MPYPNIAKPAKIYHVKYDNYKLKTKKAKLNSQTSEKILSTSLIGPPGQPGKPGSKIFVENGIPNRKLGMNNDLYLDKSTNNYYQKLRNEWILQGNLTGNPGAKGESGEKGETGVKGDAGMKGDNGEPGSKIYAQANFPVDGKENDLFINNSDNNYYLRENNQWILKGSFGDMPCNDKLTYTIFSTPLNAITTIPIFSSIAYFTWYYTNYKTYTDALIIFNSIIHDRNLVVKIVDIENRLIMSPFIITKNGIYTIPFQMPKYNTVLDIQISKNHDGGENPSIYSAILEINKSLDQSDN